MEGFNGKLRNELLNRELFLSLAEARWVIDRWCLDYNHHRPHSALDYQTPAAFAAGCVLPGSPGTFEKSPALRPPEHSRIHDPPILSLGLVQRSRVGHSEQSQGLKRDSALTARSLTHQPQLRQHILSRHPEFEILCRARLQGCGVSFEDAHSVESQ